MHSLCRRPVLSIHYGRFRLRSATNTRCLQSCIPLVKHHEFFCSYNKSAWYGARVSSYNLGQKCCNTPPPKSMLNWDFTWQHWIRGEGVGVTTTFVQDCSFQEFKYFLTSNLENSLIFNWFHHETFFVVRKNHHANYRPMDDSSYRLNFDLGKKHEIDHYS